MRNHYAHFIRKKVQKIIKVWVVPVDFYIDYDWPANGFRLSPILLLGFNLSWQDLIRLSIAGPSP